MLLDNYLTFNQKTYISIFTSMIWIYYRNLGCYALLPRKNIMASILVSIWMYCNYIEPLSVPIGLIIMCIFSIFYKKKTNL